MTDQSPNDPQHGIVVAPEKARQGVLRHRMIKVLALSLVMALVVLVVLMIWTWRVVPGLA